MELDRTRIFNQKYELPKEVLHGTKIKYHK